MSVQHLGRSVGHRAGDGLAQAWTARDGFWLVRHETKEGIALHLDSGEVSGTMTTLSCVMHDMTSTLLDGSP